MRCNVCNGPVEKDRTGYWSHYASEMEDDHAVVVNDRQTAAFRALLTARFGAHPESTGGGCMALIIYPPEGHVGGEHIMVTSACALLPDVGEEIMVGAYDAEGDYISGDSHDDPDAAIAHIESIRKGWVA